MCGSAVSVPRTPSVARRIPRKLSPLKYATLWIASHMPVAKAVRLRIIVRYGYFLANISWFPFCMFEFVF